ncbi:hypothetical protein AX16_007797 [Volvariella volvacea WC 439]|nr:hypothetical protein AX16_007797 [Volvariella volvacea WC 439]
MALKKSALLLIPLGRHRRKKARVPTPTQYQLIETLLASRPFRYADGSTLENKDMIKFPKRIHIPPPNDLLIDFFYRVSSFAHWIGLEEKRRGGGFKSWSDGLIPIPVALYRWLFRLLPSSLRLRLYFLLARMGERLYGKPHRILTGLAQRLPFGLYLKQGRNFTALQNEENALKVVEQRTNILAPRHIDTLVLDKKHCYMIITRVPGKPLYEVFDTLTMEDIEILRHDIANVISRLRTIDNPNESLICNTHGDLHAGNLIMLNGRLSGIVDWEATGWMPAYWEYVKLDRMVEDSPALHLIQPGKICNILGEDWSRERSRQYRIWKSIRRV